MSAWVKPEHLAYLASLTDEQLQKEIWAEIGYHNVGT